MNSALAIRFQHGSTLDIFPNKRVYLSHVLKMSHGLYFPNRKGKPYEGGT